MNNKIIEEGNIFYGVTQVVFKLYLVIGTCIVNVEWEREREREREEGANRQARGSNILEFTDLKTQSL